MAAVVPSTASTPRSGASSFRSAHDDGRPPGYRSTATACDHVALGTFSRGRKAAEFYIHASGNREVTKRQYKEIVVYGGEEYEITADVPDTIRDNKALTEYFKTALSKSIPGILPGTDEFQMRITPGRCTALIPNREPGQRPVFAPIELPQVAELSTALYEGDEPAFLEHLEYNRYAHPDKPVFAPKFQLTEGYDPLPADEEAQPAPAHLVSKLPAQGSAAAFLQTVTTNPLLDLDAMQATDRFKSVLKTCQANRMESQAKERSGNGSIGMWVEKDTLLYYKPNLKDSEARRVHPHEDTAEMTAQLIAPGLTGKQRIVRTYQSRQPIDPKDLPSKALKISDKQFIVVEERKGICDFEVEMIVDPQGKPWTGVSLLSLIEQQQKPRSEFESSIRTKSGIDCDQMGQREEFVKAPPVIAFHLGRARLRAQCKLPPTIIPEVAVPERFNMPRSLMPHDYAPAADKPDQYQLRSFIIRGNDSTPSLSGVKIKGEDGKTQYWLCGPDGKNKQIDRDEFLTLARKADQLFYNKTQEQLELSEEEPADSDEPDPSPRSIPNSSRSSSSSSPSASPRAPASAAPLPPHHTASLASGSAKASRVSTQPKKKSPRRPLSPLTSSPVPRLNLAGIRPDGSSPAVRTQAAAVKARVAPSRSVAATAPARPSRPRFLAPDPLPRNEHAQGTPLEFRNHSGVDCCPAALLQVIAFNPVLADALEAGLDESSERAAALRQAIQQYKTAVDSPGASVDPQFANRFSQFITQDANLKQRDPFELLEALTDDMIYTDWNQIKTENTSLRLCSCQSGQSAPRGASVRADGTFTIAGDDQPRSGIANLGILLSSRSSRDLADLIAEERFDLAGPNIHIGAETYTQLGAHDQFVEAPNVLVIQPIEISRRRTIDLTVPERLTLPAHRLAGIPDGDPLPRYQLRSFFVHRPGHYIAYVKTKGVDGQAHYWELDTNPRDGRSFRKELTQDEFLAAARRASRLIYNKI